MQEFRFTTRSQVRSDLNTSRTISGYAATFGTRTDIGPFVEEIRRGAFSRAIRLKQDVRCLVNHDANFIVGRVSNGKLLLSEDSRGLKFVCDVAKTSAGDDLLKLLARGDVGECSFGFQVVRDEWSRAKDSSGRMQDLRTLVDVDLFDVSIVAFPAYGGTSVTADSALAATAGAGRMAFMLPAGAPTGAPVEVRSRIQQALQISDEEFLERLRARTQAERLLDDRDHLAHALDVLKSI